jgi:hypothetical protein
MPTEQYTNDATTTLVNTIAAGDTSITVQSTVGFPTIPTFHIRIDNEILLVTAVSGATWTVSRAVEACQGTILAVAHAAGATVAEVLTADSLKSIPNYGSVKIVTISPHSGITASITNGTTVPNIDISLGNITPTSVAASGNVTGSNLSGTNTGDQTITLTGDVSGSGTGSFAVTIGTHAVSYAKIQQANAHTLLGNPTGSTANVQEVTLGSGLSFSGTTLTATGGGGGMSIGGGISGASGTATLLYVDASGNLQQHAATTDGHDTTFNSASGGYTAELTSTTYAGQFAGGQGTVTLSNSSYAIQVSNTGSCFFSNVFQVSAGTQLAFFGVGTVGQQSTTGTGATGFTQNSSSNDVYAESTFDGGLGGTAYTISDIVLALKKYGLLAS